MDIKLKQTLNEIIRQDNQSKMYQCERLLDEINTNYGMGMLTEHESTGQKINLLQDTFRNLTSLIN